MHHRSRNLTTFAIPKKKSCKPCSITRPLSIQTCRQSLPNCCYECQNCIEFARYFKMQIVRTSRYFPSAAPSYDRTTTFLPSTHLLANYIQDSKPVECAVIAWKKCTLSMVEISSDRLSHLCRLAWIYPETLLKFHLVHIIPNGCFDAYEVKVNKDIRKR